MTGSCRSTVYTLLSLMYYCPSEMSHIWYRRYKETGFEPVYWCELSFPPTVYIKVINRPDFLFYESLIYRLNSVVLIYHLKCNRRRTDTSNTLCKNVSVRYARYIKDYIPLDEPPSTIPSSLIQK